VAEPVVLVHGFSQTRRSWDPLRHHLPARWRPVVVELPGHGASGLARGTFVETARAIGEAGGPAAYAGYSMGGRLCLRLALDRPDLVRALVLVSASPGLADGSERRRRRRSDAWLAKDIEEGGTEGFLERWLAQPLFEATAVPPEELAARRANPPEDLAAALRLLGTGSQEPLWDRLAGLGVPTLLLVGERDAKFRAIAERMAQLCPASRTAVVAGAGHAVPLDAPGPCAHLLDEFLARHLGGPGSA